MDSSSEVELGTIKFLSLPPELRNHVYELLGVYSPTVHFVASPTEIPGMPKHSLIHYLWSMSRPSDLTHLMDRTHWPDEPTREEIAKTDDINACLAALRALALTNHQVKQEVEGLFYNSATLVIDVVGGKRWKIKWVNESFEISLGVCKHVNVPHRVCEKFRYLQIRRLRKRQA